MRSLFAFFLISLMTSSLASSAFAKSPRKKLETYPATDEAAGSFADGLDEPLPHPTPAPAPKGIKSRVLSNQAQATKSKKILFDLVPENQIEPIASRLELVGEIIRKHRRAYDYRVHTVKELEQILAALDELADGDSDL